MSTHPGSTPVSKPYDHQPYPAVRYRRTDDGTVEHCRVLTAEEDEALGPEWCASPADVASERAESAPAARGGSRGRGGKPAGKTKADEPAAPGADSGDLTE